MPRIPEDELSRLKSSVDLAALIRMKGVELKAQGADLVGRCPFHDDKTPSLIVTPAKGLWHCMGACQMGGDVLTWLMKAEGVSFRHAVELLREGKASSLIASDKVVKFSTVPKLPPPVALDADDQALLNQVTDYYHRTLLEDPLGHAAREYLEKRGLFYAEAVKTFKLGFANRTLGLRLPEKNREAGANIRKRLEGLGVFRTSSGHEHLAGSLIVPILDEQGNTLGLYGRKVVENLRTGTPKHLYLPGPHRGFFNAAALHHPEVILCEAVLDALSFWVHGFRNVTAAYGVEGFTDEMLSGFITRGVRRVYIAYDRDEAGDKAAGALARQLMAEGIECLRVLFPHKLDANEYVRKVTPAEKSLEVLLNSAEWLGKGARPATSPAAVVSLPSGETVDVDTGEILNAPPTPEPSSLAASPPAAEASATPVPYEVRGEDVHVTLSERGYRVRGLHKNQSFEVLRVNLRVAVGPRFYIDTLDFYNAKARQGFLIQAAVEVEAQQDVLKRDLGRLLLLLEKLQEERITETLAPKAPLVPRMSESEEAAALALLKAPNLTERILDDLTACGYVGEGVNKLVAYLAAVSRKLEEPLSLLIQSSSAAGKSSLMEAVLDLLPSEDKAQYSALTGQALFYMDATSLKHKVLAVAEDAGMQKAAYALKMLITEKRLAIASTGKDPQTGKLVTQTYEVEGPTSVFYTTTAAEVDPELKNRCVVLTIDEEKEQTRAILELQRQGQTLEGRRSQARRTVLRSLHQNAQRLLRPLTVVNPYAPHLTFASGQSRLRRDQRKYLTLISAVALLYQHQRTVKLDDVAGEYIEATLEDVALAGRLCAEVLGRTLDELAPQTRRLLKQLTAMVEEEAKTRAVEWGEVRFTRFDVRNRLSMGHSQLAVHLQRLVELEYVAVHRGQTGLRYEYSLLYKGEGEEGGRFLLGLIDAEELRKKHGYDGDLPALGNNLPGGFRVPSGHVPGVTAHAKAKEQKDLKPLPPETPEITYKAAEENTPSYRTRSRTAAAKGG